MNTSQSLNFKQQFVLVIFGSLLALLTAELFARAWLYYIEGHGKSVAERLQVSDDVTTQLSGNTTNLRGLIRSSKVPGLTYELRPKTSGMFLNKAYRSNSFGARDDEYSLKKPEGVFRIAGIGDSVMFGWGVESNETYLSVLEEKLNAKGRKTEIINFGTPGYNTAMEVTLFKEKVIHFQPDALVLHVVNNDLEVPLFMAKPHNVFSLKESFLRRLVLPVNTNYDTSSLVRSGMGNSEDVIEEYRHLAGWKAFSQSLRDLGKFAAEHKIPVFVVYGRLPLAMRQGLKKAEMEEHFKLVPVKKFVEEILEEHHIPNDPDARAAAIQVSPEDFHPNALGHQAYVRALEPLLVKLIEN